MDEREVLERWTATVIREGIGIGAVFNVCVSWGIAPRRARDLAEEAVQQALSKAAEIAGLAARFENSGHFCNWVRCVAINYAISVLRRERRQLPWPDGDQFEFVPGTASPLLETLREFLAGLTEDERRLLRAIAMLCREGRQWPRADGDRMEAEPAEALPLLESLRKFLAGLTEDERRLLLLRYDEDLTLDEVAARYFPPDDRTENARRLEIWRRSRDIKERFCEWLAEHKP